MPPIRQRHNDFELEDLRMQIQQLQETVNAQQVLLDEYQQKSNFEGKLQPDEFVDWLQTVERVFEYKEVPEEKKVKIIVVKLKKHASIWWENLKKKREREGKRKIKTWEKMRRELTRKFLPVHYRWKNILESLKS
jgi:CRISPR/Cas system-associated endoribonuclease Cas2